MIPTTGPYPYVVTLRVTTTTDGKPVDVPVQVIAYNPIDAMSMAAINAQGDGTIPISANMRAVKVEPDYTYSQKPTPGADPVARQITDAVADWLYRIAERPGVGSIKPGEKQGLREEPTP